MTDALEQLNLALEVAQELGRQLAANDRLDRHGRRRVTGLRIRESGLRRGDTYESIPSIDGRERASADLLSDFVRSDLVARLGIHPRASTTRAGACSARFGIPQKTQSCLLTMPGGLCVPLGRFEGRNKFGSVNS